ncbi:MAG: nucleotide exchange factor GrpE [Akkermansiaceae bacterium]
MQDPTEETEKQVNEENPSAEEYTAADVTMSADAADTEGETEEAVETDPWEALELEVAKWKDQAIRKSAELDNFRKRMSREKIDAVRYGNQGLLEELLPVLDNFDMGMMAAEKEEGSMLYIGMNMVRKQIGEFFSSQNVEEITAEAGGDFDPNLHEALSQEPSDEIEAGKIIRVMRKGYRIGDRLLRPSNVIISQEAGNPETESE